MLRSGLNTHVQSPTPVVDPAQRTAHIRELNDRLRANFISGVVTITIGVRQLRPYVLSKVLAAVRGFDAFTADNDSHGEHDFGTLVVEGNRIFWKIDYYDKRLEAGSEDPSSSDATTRVLTIMLATEY